MPQPRLPGRPAPVGDPVLEALAARPDELARRWLLALLEAAPLDDAPGVPVDALAQDGPAFCAAFLDAVRSDHGLDALLDAGSRPGPSELMRLSGTSDGAATVAAAEALRRAAGEAAAELASGAAAVPGGLADRLAHVCARLAAGALVAPGVERRAAAPEPAQEPPEEASAFAAGPSRPAPSPSGAPLWVAALERQVAQGGRFALLLVELDGAERLRLAEGPEGARDMFARVGRAVRGGVRRSDLLAHEDDGRMWIIAPDAGRSGASSLAGRVADAVEGAASSRGTPLTASVGVALYPDDGRTSGELTGQAEESFYAARAAGVRLAHDIDEPAANGPRLVP